MPDKSQRGAIQPLGHQLRSYPAQYEVRTMAGGKVELRGYASTTEKPYEMNDFFGGYSEVVRAGAFTKTLAAGPDVAYLANHGGLTLARSVNGTLRLSEDSTGLDTVATLNTARGDARDLVTAVEDGDIDQMSFAFRVDSQEWSPDYEERALVALDLHRGDVSAVNYGANPDTSVGLQRSFAGADGARFAQIVEELRSGRALDASAGDFAARALSAMAAGALPGQREHEDAAAAQALEAVRALHADHARVDVLRRQLEHDRQRSALRA